MPMLCLTIDNGPGFVPDSRGNRCFVAVASSWCCVRADEDLRRVLSVPCCSFHLCSVSSSRLGPRQRIKVLSFLAEHCVALVLAWACVCWQGGGRRLQSPYGSGQEPWWQEKASGCLAVDFLWCRWGPCAVGFPLPLEFVNYVNTDNRLFV